jgi:hypothetical protein
MHSLPEMPTVTRNEEVVSTCLVSRTNERISLKFGIRDLYLHPVLDQHNHYFKFSTNKFIFRLFKDADSTV